MWTPQTLSTSIYQEILKPEVCPLFFLQKCKYVCHGSKSMAEMIIRGHLGTIFRWGENILIKQKAMEGVTNTDEYQSEMDGWYAAEDLEFIMCGESLSIICSLTANKQIKLVQNLLSTQSSILKQNSNQTYQKLNKTKWEISYLVCSKLVCYYCQANNKMVLSHSANKQSKLQINNHIVLINNQNCK